MAQPTPEEFIEAISQFVETLNNGNSANRQQAEALMKTWGLGKKETEELISTSKKLGTSTSTLAKGMITGADSAKNMANTLDMVVNGLELILALIPGYRLLKIGIMLTTKALAGLTKAATEQAQAEFKAYQQLNQIGAAGAKGLQGVFDTVQKFGYNVGELDKMVALVAANSENLAKFGGLASQGTTAFSDAMNQLTHGAAAVELGALGKTLEDINGAGASYIRQQTLLGRTQRDIGNDLAGKTKQYIMDLDRLQRLTGTSADALQKQQEAGLADSAYASYMDQLRSSGEAGEAQARKIQAVLATLDPEMQALARRGIGGDIGAAQQLNFIAPTLIKNLRDSGATFENTVGSVNQDLINFKDKFGQAYQLNAAGIEEIGLKYITISNTIASTSNITERAALAKLEQEQAGNAEDVKRMANTAVLDRERKASLETMIQKGVEPATIALEKLAQAATGVTNILPGTKGVTTGAGEVAKVAPGVQIVGSAEARSKAENYYGKKISDAEFSALIKATHAEAAAGKKANQQEQAMIMASVLNRARADAGGIMGALLAKNQFQAVTGTRYKPGPSDEFQKGPDTQRLKSIEGATTLLDKISKEQKNFTAADPNAYKAGTNIGYRNKMLVDGGQIIGGTVFQTKMQSDQSNNAKLESATTNKTFDILKTKAQDLANATMRSLENVNKQYLSTSTAPNSKTIAPTLTGPNSRYDAKTADIQPASTLPTINDNEKTRAAAQNNIQSEDLINKWAAQLEESTRLQRETNDKLAKISNNTQ